MRILRSILSVPVVAIQALTQTITMLTQAGRFRQAADREKEIAQIYLQEMHDLRRACEAYERAGDWYAQEDAAAYVKRMQIYDAALIILQHCECLLQGCCRSPCGA